MRGHNLIINYRTSTFINWILVKVGSERVGFPLKISRLEISKDPITRFLIKLQ
jgi:hypothetical protein